MTITFSFTVNSGHTIEIQWYKDGAVLVDGTYGDTTVSGATTNTLVITNPDATWDGSYYASVHDITADCTITTDPLDVVIPGQCRLEITTQPVSQELDEGDTLELTVAATGNADTITYQWYLDGNPLTDGASGSATISGATTATLTITDITTALAGDYTVILVDTGIADCSVASSAATIDVNAECTLVITDQIERGLCNITILTEPENNETAEGNVTGFSFTYFSDNPSPVTIQWYFDGNPLSDGVDGFGATISGATTDDLVISDTQLGNAGDYYAIVTNGSCVQQTDTVTLTVNEAPSANDPTAYWRLDEINEPIVGGEGPATDRADAVGSSTLSVGLGTVPGYQDAIGGVAASAFFQDDSSGLLDTGTIADLAYVTGNSISISFWMKFRTDPTAGDEIPRLELILGGSESIELQSYISGPNRVLYVSIDGSTFDDITINPFSLAIDTWQFVTLVYDGGTGLLHLYLDGSLAGSTSTPSTLASAANGQFSLYMPNAFGVGTLISQCGIWTNLALSGPQITYLYNSGSGRDWPFTLP